MNAYSQTSASAPGATAASAASAPAKSNRALRRSVYSAIVKHKEINAGNISVIAKDGAVTLNGTVTESAQIEKVAEIAKGVPGVTSVSNKLTVAKPLGGM
ncbi:BON domain-containing protein [Paraburkholderia piptadeniae]|nr:BON domain-containing protein [Paraburkholderia piptadeniae]